MTLQLLSPPSVLLVAEFPYEIGDPDGVLAMPALDRLPEADGAKIKSGNALRLLWRRAPGID